MNKNRIKNEDRIYLLRRIVQDVELSDEAIATYVGIRYLMTSNKACFFSDYILYRILFGHSGNPKDKKLINLRSGMREFFNVYELGNEYIGTNTYMLDECDKDELLIDTITPAFDEYDFFFSVSWKHINRIMSLKGKVDKFKMIRLYLVMVSTINLKTHIGFTGREKLCELTGLSSATITKYQRILVNLRVLHIVENGAVRNKETGKVINLSNTYSLYENADLCEQLAKDRRAEIRGDADDEKYWEAIDRRMDLNEEELNMTDMIETNERIDKRIKGKQFFSNLSNKKSAVTLDETEDINPFGEDFNYNYDYEYDFDFDAI